MKLAVIIPAFNEERTIGKVVHDVPRLSNFEQETIVVSDGSTDRTAEIAEQAGATVHRFAGNRGIVAAINKGLALALARDSDYLVVLDGDGQHNPADIPRLLAPLIEGTADIVNGSRFLGTIEHMTTLKYLGNRFFSALISGFVKQKLTDTQSGFRAYTREVAETLNVNRGRSFSQQMIVQAIFHGFKIVELPIVVKARRGKSKLVSNPFAFANHLFNLLLMLLAMYYPLRFFTFLGICFVILGVFVGRVIETANVLASLIILTGVQCILFGALFEILKGSRKS